MIARLRTILAKRYEASRGISLGPEQDISLPRLARVAFARLAWAIRGAARGRYGVFIGPMVRIKHGSQLRVGARSSIGRASVLDSWGLSGIRIGEQTTIDEGAVLRASGTVRRQGVGIEIGNRSAIGWHCFLHGGGGIRIGNNVLIGPNVCIISEEHNIANANVPIIEQGETPRPISIGDDCWIGANATILGGVTIGPGAIVGAGAVVARDVPSFAVVAGVPARVLRIRSQ